MVQTLVVGACTLQILWVCFGCGWTPVGSALEEMGLQETVRASHAIAS